MGAGPDKNMLMPSAILSVVDGPPFKLLFVVLTGASPHCFLHDLHLLFLVLMIFQFFTPLYSRVKYNSTCNLPLLIGDWTVEIIVIQG